MFYGFEVWDNKWLIDNCVKVSLIFDFYLDFLNIVDFNFGIVM